MTATEYTVRINSRDGALEVVGPDKEWVDAKVEQLTSVFADYRPGTTTDAPERATPKTTSRKRSTSATSTTDGVEPRPTRRARGTGGRAVINRDLADLLTPDIKKKFGSYVAARRKAWKSLSNQAAIIAAFLQDEVDWRAVDQHDLYTVYTVMGEKTPGNMRSQLVNARQRARFFGNVVNGKTSLSHKGENFARHDSLDSASGDES